MLKNIKIKRKKKLVIMILLQNIIFKKKGIYVRY